MEQHETARGQVLLAQRVMTGADRWTLADGTHHPTGFWADEAVVPYEAFRAAGHEVTVATPGGVVPPVDPAGLAPEAAGGAGNAARIAEVVETAAEFQGPVALTDVRLDEYDAVYVPGGHGPMEDLAVDADSGRILARAVGSGMPVGVVCHGPAALLAAVGEDGANAFAGYRITAFTNAEEELAGSAAKAKWLLQDRLTEAGLKVGTGVPFADHAEPDHTEPRTSSSSRRTPRAFRADCPGRPGRTSPPRSGSTCCTPGWWRTCPEAAYASSPRRPRSAGPPPSWPGRRRTRCSTATRHGSTGLSAPPPGRRRPEPERACPRHHLTPGDRMMTS
ncbi:hypothetical protein GCM10023083_34220 [Streptomyces phyllanthi]